MLFLTIFRWVPKFLWWAVQIGLALFVLYIGFAAVALLSVRAAEAVGLLGPRPVF